MLIASWNVNSIRTRLSQVLEWIQINNIDVLCLQETKTQDESFPIESFEKLGYEVKVSGQKSYNGVAIISKYKIDDVKIGFKGELGENPVVKNLDDQKRVISAYINGLRIINVYVPNGSSIDSDKFRYKLDWLNVLSTYVEKLQERDEMSCLLGDFNIAPSNLDIYDPQKYEGGIMASQLERAHLNNVVKGRFIDSFRVFEKSYGFWSWWDYRNNAFELNKGWRIDHIYISNNLLSNIKSSVIERDQRGLDQPSDHAPIMIELNFQKQFDDIGDDDDDDLFEL